MASSGAMPPSPWISSPMFNDGTAMAMSLAAAATSGTDM